MCGTGSTGSTRAWAQQPSHYQDHLRGLGYDGPNPWEQWANSAEGGDGAILSGWLMQHADRPARIEEPDSESALRDDPRHRVHRAGGRRAVVPAPELHQAALAVHRPRALPRDVWPG